ncbi:hypothetical protein [Nocardia aurea]|uniref:hypothetical protein n=1 Tax=Nocardia aurea TaxID=2144174 RepID=UPI0033AC8A83
MTALSALAELRDGWDGPGSKAIPTRMFASYASLAAEFGGRIPADLEPMAGHDGGIRLEWSRPPEHFSADIEPDGGLYLCRLAESDGDDEERQYPAFDRAVLRRFYETGRIEQEAS